MLDPEAKLLLLAAAPNTGDVIRCEGASEGFELAPLEAAEGDKPKPRRFSMTAYTGAAIRQPGYSAPMVVDLSGVKIPRQDMPILKQHDAAQIVGHTTEIAVSAQRIKLAGVMSGVGDAAKEVAALASNGFPWQASIGGSIDKLEWVEADSKVNVNGRSFTGPLYVIRALTLRETSFVPIGADGATSATVAASNKGNPVTYEQWLAAKGFDPAALTDTQHAFLKALFADQGKPTPPPELPKVKPAEQVVAAGAANNGDFAAQMAAIKAENERIGQIRQETVGVMMQYTGNVEKCKLLEQMCEAAVADTKCDIKSYQLQLIRAARHDGPFIATQKTERVTSEVIEAAVCKAGGLKTLEKDFAPNVLELADKKFKGGGIGLQEMISLCAEANGFRGNARRDLRGALRAAFREDDNGYGNLAASVGPSTLTIAGILSNVANKFVREAFMFVENSWSQITATRSVSDFKTITGYSLTGDLTYEKVAGGGEIKEGTLGELSYTNKADTYGKLLGIDRQQLINDDLGALAQASRRLGRGGALKINDVFWTKFLNNSTFFTSGRGNYDDGASDTLMDLTGLQNAHTLFTNITDPDGKPTGTTPAIVLVPPALWASAWKLLTATPGGDTTATVSPFAGMFRLVTSRYLSNSAYTGYSAKAWYMLADPNDLPVIEMVFLNGNTMPTVETADLDFNRLGIAIRGYHDFGAELQEYRGGVKMKGEA